jgi:hypothetical protein
MSLWRVSMIDVGRCMQVMQTAIDVVVSST